MPDCGNIFLNAGPDPARERFETLAQKGGVKIERIISTGQANAPDEWYDQNWSEWVLLLRGSALLRIEGEADARRLQAGDWIEIAPHVRHRVEETSADPPALWVAVHID